MILRVGRPGSADPRALAEQAADGTSFRELSRQVNVGTPRIPLREAIPISEYIHGTFVPLSNLPHGWEMHSAVALTPAEDRTTVREPAQAVPDSIAARIGKLRVLVVPWVACMDTGDEVQFTKPQGETHSAVWIETGERIHLVLPCKELDPHDTGLEFLASIAELLRPRLTAEEMGRFSRLLEIELRAGVTGEIDEDARAAKQPLMARRARRKRSPELFANYCDTSFVSTAAEYMHGLWHDVQIRVGPEHLPVPQLRRRMTLLAEMFPPNAGYSLFAEGLEKGE
jgi:hypothetical protein